MAAHPAGNAVAGINITTHAFFLTGITAHAGMLSKK
jgi:hypothetical protein